MKVFRTLGLLIEQTIVSWPQPENEKNSSRLSEVCVVFGIYI